MKISACMIVKNEESCVEKCLQSLDGIDELVVLDTGSTDRTGEIVRKYTDLFYPDEYTWEESFCKARNYALAKCTGDWVLSIDADEWLEPGGLQKIRKAVKFAEEHEQLTINCIMVANITNSEFLFPRLFKRCPEVYWKGDVHNHLSVTSPNKSDIRITYGLSETHAKDPDRSLRILLRVMKENPTNTREAFYLAREYWYKKDWITAIYWYQDYLSRADWPPEFAEACLMLARCYWELDKNSEAKDACLRAIKINADFKEALEFMAELCGPKNRAKWLLYAEMANNDDVLTVEKKVEKQAGYYNDMFTDSADMSRYYHIYNRIGKMIDEEEVLDIGCGVAMLQSFIKHYHGFDFSEKAVEIANNPNVWIGNAYDKVNYGDYDAHASYDVYLCTEVLEHLDDYKILSNIPKGKRVIFSVPSFDDPSHVRKFTEEIIRYRYKGMIEITDIQRFNWQGEWRLGGEPTSSYILLVDARRI